MIRSTRERLRDFDALERRRSIAIRQFAPDAIRHSLPSASERDASTGAGDFLHPTPEAMT